MKAYILKCKPNAQFHLGEIALDENTALNKTSEVIHSDTLFASLVSVYAQVWGNPQNFIEKLKNYKLSTAFHCLEHEGKFVFFLPKPIHFNFHFSNSDNPEAFNNFKSFKKIKYISAGIWQKGLSANDLLKEQSHCTLIDGKYVCLKSEVQDWNTDGLKITNEITLPKVHVRKPSKEDSLYYQTNLQIVDNSSRKIYTHFYFLAEKELDSEIERCLDVLIHAGIGGERSTGSGSVADWHTTEHFPDIQFDHARTYALLSLFLPKDDQEIKQLLYYQLILRGGRRIGKAHPSSKEEKYLKQIRMVSEGAVLESPVEGKILDISPTKNDIYLRSGLALVLPLHPNLNNYANL